MSKYNERRRIRKGTTLAQGIAFLVEEIIEAKKQWWLKSNEYKKNNDEPGYFCTDNIEDWNYPNGDSTFPKQDMEKMMAGMTTSEGKKYIKIKGPESIWGFIVKEDFTTSKGRSFKKGDVLMASGFNAPALNRSRGNVLTGEGHIQWTGPEYLI